MLPGLSLLLTRASSEIETPSQVARKYGPFPFVIEHFLLWTWSPPFLRGGLQTGGRTDSYCLPSKIQGIFYKQRVANGTFSWSKKQIICPNILYMDSCKIA